MDVPDIAAPMNKPWRNVPPRPITTTIPKAKGTTVPRIPMKIADLLTLNSFLGSVSRPA